MLGAFEVLSVRINLRYCKLQLPASWKIHSVFNIDLLERYKGTNPKKHVFEIEADGNDWEMESIITSRPSDDNPRHHVFLVKWRDSAHEDNTWETFDNVVESNWILLEDHYKKNTRVASDTTFTSGKRRKLSKK